MASCCALDSDHCHRVLIRIGSEHRAAFASHHSLAVRTFGPGELRSAPYHPAKGRPFSRIWDFRFSLVSCFFGNLSEGRTVHLGRLGHRVYFLNCLARRVASKLLFRTDRQIRGCGARYLWGPSARVRGHGCDPAASLVCRREILLACGECFQHFPRTTRTNNLLTSGSELASGCTSESPP